MSTEQNKKSVQLFFEQGMNNKNLDLANEVLAPSYQNHAFPDAVGLDGFKQVMEGFFAGFPDMKINVEQIIAEGDTVATRGYFTGTNSGDFMGIPASSKKIKVNYMDFFRFENGKCVENWVQLDNMTLMQQIGAMPEPSM